MSPQMDCCLDAGDNVCFGPNHSQPDAGEVAKVEDIVELKECYSSMGICVFTLAGVGSIFSFVAFHSFLVSGTSSSIKDTTCNYMMLSSVIWEQG